MNDKTAAQAAPRPVDGVALQRARQRVESAAQAPWLHQEMARRMAERLSLFKRKPQMVLDWWPAGGGSLAALQATLPEAEQLQLGEPPASQPLEKGRWSSWLAQVKRWGSQPTMTSKVRHVAQADGPPAAQADLVWANMLLHHVQQPTALIQRWHDALAVDGFLMFSTLGPGTLPSLRALYRRQGWGEPMGALVDMHDWGDMLVEAGFADPVMDQEVLTLTWATPAQALAELRTLGANVHGQRFAGLRTPRWRDVLTREMLQAESNPGQSPKVSLQFELVYGHAFKA
ncbi:MAG: methyltransferase domain-containing protein, partial [Rubrivivax sp.]